MKTTFFSHWQLMLFATIPLGSLLFFPLRAGSLPALVLSLLLCTVLAALVPRFAQSVQQFRPARWCLTLAALWRSGSLLLLTAHFLSATLFPGHIYELRLVTIVLCLWLGLHPRALLGMAAYPVVFATIVLCLTAALLSVGKAHAGAILFSPPDTLSLLRSLLLQFLPDTLLLSLSPPIPAGRSAALGLTIGGGISLLLCAAGALLLGHGTAALLSYPVFVALGLSSPAHFAAQSAVLFSAPLLICQLLRISALLTLPLLPLRRFFAIMKGTGRKTT